MEPGSSRKHYEPLFLDDEGVVEDDEDAPVYGAYGSSLPSSSPSPDSTQEEELDNHFAELDAGLAATRANVPQLPSPPTTIENQSVSPIANQNASPPTANEASSPIDISSDEEDPAPVPAPAAPAPPRARNRPKPRPRDFTPWGNDPDATFTNTFDEKFELEVDGK